MDLLDHLVAPLFVPANRPERFAKAAASGADAVILDLEDAVAPADKAAARDALNARFTDLPVIVRINAADTPWHADDLAAVARAPFAAIMLPKAERVADCARVSAIHPALLLIETARGIAECRTLAASGHAARMAFGSVDFAADLGCSHLRESLTLARCELVLASRLGGLPRPIDGVTTNLSDLKAAEEDAAFAHGLGFGGKLLIHPSQVAPTMKAFLPTAEELDWARRALATGDGVTTLDGVMVDAPVRAHARAIILRAGVCHI